MNQRSRIIDYLMRMGRSSCDVCEKALHIRSETTRVSEINKRHLREHGFDLIKATKQSELNPLGVPHPVTYYEIIHEAQQRDLFSQK